MHTHPHGRTRRLGFRPVGVVGMGPRIAFAMVVVGLSIFATAGTSGATVGVKNRCVPRPKADLEGCDYAHANLTDANLKGATLTRANLTGANLDGAKLKDANFSGAELYKVSSGGIIGTPISL